jgi:outer membrane protein TolC
MNRITFIFLGMVWLFPASLFAQENWTLRDCITYGLKNHRSNRVYANEKLAADAKAKEALSGYLPSVNINGSLDDNLKVQQSVIPAGLFGPQDIKVAFTKKFNTNASIQLDQPIYDQSLLTGLQANKYVKEQANLNLQLNEETIIYNISTAYYQLFVYREQLALLKANMKTYQGQLAVSALKVKKGVISEVELNKIEVNYNNTRSNINVAEQNLLLSAAQLKNVMGFPLDQPLALDTAGSPTDYTLPDKLSKDSVFAASNRTDYLLSGINATLLNIDQKRIRADAYPKLSFYARYGGVGFGDELGQSFSGISDFSAIGIKLKIPLFDGFKRNAQYNQAKYKQLNAVENLKLDADKYRLEYENARTKLVKAQTNVQNDQRNIVLAQSVFKSTDLQCQKGVTDLTDWLNAQNSLKEAQNNYLNSLFNFYLAGIDLEKANGTLKSFYNAL